MKKLIYMLLCVCALALLVACGDDERPSKKKDRDKVNTESKYDEDEEPKVTPTPTPIELVRPRGFTFKIDGEMLDINWDDVAHAEKYEIKFKEQDVYVEESCCTINNIIYGNSYELSVRAVNESTGTPITSGWTSVSYTAPSFNYGDLYLSDVMCLSKTEAIEWAINKGYDYDEDFTDEGVVLTIHYKDMENSGLFNKAGSVIGAVAAGIFGGYSEAAADDFSNPQSLLENYIMSDHTLKGFLKDENKSFLLHGAIGGVVSGIKVAFKKNEVYYHFCYTDVERGARLGTLYYIKNHRETLADDIKASGTECADGRILKPSKIFDTNIYYQTSDTVESGLKKWGVLLTKFEQ